MKIKKPWGRKKKVTGNDLTQPDTNADHSGSDSSSNKTVLDQDPLVEPRYDKPAREQNPDRTGIDTKADKTKG